MTLVLVVLGLALLAIFHSPALIVLAVVAGVCLWDSRRR